MWLTRNLTPDHTFGWAPVTQHLGRLFSRTTPGNNFSCILVPIASGHKHQGNALGYLLHCRFGSLSELPRTLLARERLVLRSFLS